MKKEKDANLAQKQTIERSQKGVYMADKVWDAVEKRASKTDRSSNYVIEKALISYFNLY